MSDLFDGEQPPVYDEAVTGTGRIRPPWQQLIGRLGPSGPGHIGELRDEAMRLLRQNGVTYTVYGDPQGSDRLWPLDIVPLLITAEEWQELESGVRQRAHLLNALLQDIYGPQRTAAEGLVPASLLDANPGLVRAVHGMEPPGGIYLHLYAVDLVRGADAKWRVLEDRTEAPSGAGYALENRSVVGRVLADCLAECQAVPLTPFFGELREGLLALAPKNAAGRQPRLVLLTPGPYNETYFEHVYLARHLGISLVEGGDLTVRDRRVFLKTVTALEPVDVILRRIDDGYLDPLELQPDSALGVAGLVEAARAGNVTIANAIGAGVVQAMALKPFLPGLCKRLLGEELRLPDVATWWCGGDAEREHVLANLPRRVVKPAFAGSSANTIFTDRMSERERAAVTRRIKADPLGYIAQERIHLAQTPNWDGTQLTPRPYVLRVYVAAGRNGFVVMPGGMARVASTPRGTAVSIQQGGGSKDCWVLGNRVADNAPAATEAASNSNVVPISEAVFHRMAPNELPSRAADGMFWLGRYAERTDGMVRLLRTVIGGLSDPSQPWTALDARPALDLVQALRLTPELRWSWSSPNDLRTTLSGVLTDPANPGGIAADLRAVQRVVSGLRDHLPLDCWNAAMVYGRQASTAAEPLTAVQTLLRLDELVRLAAALWGTIEETMPHTTGWSFLEIGKRLERALHLIAVVRGVVATHPGAEDRDRERHLLAAILAITGARPASHLGRDLDRRAVLETVMGGLHNPRSLAFQLTGLVTHLTALPQPNPGALTDPGLLLRARQGAEMGLGLMHEAIEAACGPRHRGVPADPMLTAFTRLSAQLWDVSQMLTQLYFTHALARPA